MQHELCKSGKLVCYLCDKTSKETTNKTKAQEGGQYEDGSWRENMGLYVLDLFGLGQGPFKGSSEIGNENSGSVEYLKVPEWLWSNVQLHQLS